MRNSIIAGLVLILVGALLIGGNYSSLQYATGGTGGTGGTSGTGGTITSSVTWSLSGSLSVYPSSTVAGNTVTLKVYVSSFSSSADTSTTLEYILDGNVIGTKSVGGTGTYSMSWVSTLGAHTFTAKYMSSDTSTGTSYSPIGTQASVVVTSGQPVIQSASASPDPVTAGNTTTFNTVVNWGGSTGTVTYAVSGGVSVGSGTGNTFTFLSAGTYKVTATAKNSYGSAQAIFYVNVLNGSNGTSTVTNEGTFYLQAPSGAYTKLTATTNLVFKFSSYPVRFNLLYVMDNGNTTDFASAYAKVGSSSVQLSNRTTYNGYRSYEGSLVISGAGTYTITGGINPVSGQQVQLFSIAGTMGNQVTSQPNTQAVQHYTQIGLGVFLMIAGILILWRRPF